MSIQVNDFKWKPGENDKEYIKLLKESADEWRRIAGKAIAKLKQQAPNNGKASWTNGRCTKCNHPYATDSWDGEILLSEQKYCYHCGAIMEVNEETRWKIISPKT